MGCAHKENQDGFTLVEISIVMIIIGLLIGGTFGGMKLIENMQVNKTVQDFKSMRSAALTFKDTYGRLPGDMPNAAARIPNCTAAPCARGGNGNRTIGLASWHTAISDTSENFTAYHHLEAAGLTSLRIQNTLDMSYGAGQPEAEIGGGFRLGYWFNTALGACLVRFNGHGFLITGEPSGEAWNQASARTVPCALISGFDQKIDDGKPVEGYVQSTCQTAFVCGANEYNPNISGMAFISGRF